MQIKLIVGLGNPGAEYEHSRHNAGAWLLQTLAAREGVRLGVDSKLHALLGKATLAGRPVWLARPTTFMNHSGRAVQALLNYYRIEPERMLIVHDDLDLPPGVARLKYDGGHGGQNGLRDIMGQLGHGRFHRLRIGIGHPGDKNRVTPWVLGRPGVQDQAAIVAAIDDALAVLDRVITGELEAAMQELHSPRG
ncbi:MAG: aminoacyl-tRNA hydrolase [Xanthomonadales bacterium]|nr:aminoacyl-tRNA hydrolase [Xanthomonadales bacterium]